MGGSSSKTRALSILALGDSLTEGMISWGEDNVPYSSFLVELLAPHMAKECTVNVSNQGVSGETTAEILQRAPFGEHWDVVVLLGGTNDLGTHEAEAIWRNLHEMYTRFEASPTKPLIVAVTIPNICAEKQPNWLVQRRNAVNDKIRAWVSEASNKRLLVDLWADMQTDASHKHLWSRDGLHFSAEGYRHFASLITTALVTFPAADMPWKKSAPENKM